MKAAGFVRIVVNRSGDTTAPVSFDYLTSDAGASGLCGALNTGLASSQCDFTVMLGTLKFAANQTQQTLDIPSTRIHSPRVRKCSQSCCLT